MISTLPIPAVKMAALVTRHRIRGTVLAGSSPLTLAVVAVIDRTVMSVLSARTVGSAGEYSFQVPMIYGGVRNVMIVATYPTDQYNAVVADRVMPETVIE